MIYYSFLILSFILFSGNVLPLSPNKHWFFRGWDFARIQLWFSSLIALFLFIFIADKNEVLILIALAICILSFMTNSIILFPFTSFYPTRKSPEKTTNKKDIKLLSINVYQYNTDYNKLIDLIVESEPDIVLTMESNKDWENGLSTIEKNYLHTIKIPLENTYGMHLYSKLPFEDYEINYYMEDDVPSITAKMKDYEGDSFLFYGVHPPPPSPTEADTTKERDGELMVIAKKVEKEKIPVLVAGDFNNVSWSKSSKLFRKKSSLIDPRIGRGIIPTFHAKYYLLKAPIDLLFHSNNIVINEIKTLSKINSDHYPLFCSFYILENEVKKNLKSTTKSEDKEIEKTIDEGKNS